MYASGLRVSELVTLKVFNVSLSENVLRVLERQQERLVPFARWQASGSSNTCPGTAQPAGGQADRGSVS